MKSWATGCQRRDLMEGNHDIGTTHGRKARKRSRRRALSERATATSSTQAHTEGLIRIIGGTHAAGLSDRVTKTVRHRSDRQRRQSIGSEDQRARVRRVSRGTSQGRARGCRRTGCHDRTASTRAIISPNEAGMQDNGKRDRSRNADGKRDSAA